MPVTPAQRLRNARLIVQPGDSFLPIVEAIDAARERVQLTVYRLDCPAIRDALCAARRRGVEVTVLVSRQQDKWRRRNQALLRQLRGHGIHARHPRGAGQRGIRDFHYKMMTVDGRTSLIFTFNPTRTNLHYCRDFGLVVPCPELTRELDRLMAADMAGEPFHNHLPDLAVGPEDTRARLFACFESARRSIHIFDSRLEDRRTLELLERRAKEGIDVKVVGSSDAYRAREGQPSFRIIDRFSLHAKAAVVDGERFYLGSANLRKKALDRRRELVLFGRDPAIGAALEKIFLADWESQSRRPGSDATMVVETSAPLRAPESEPYLLISRFDALCQLRFGSRDVRIGRAPDNDLVVSHPSVSRYHAVLRRRRGGIVVEDLGTPNGTSVNQRRIRRRRRLRPGDVLGLAEGDEFRFLES